MSLGLYALRPVSTEREAADLHASRLGSTAARTVAEMRANLLTPLLEARARHAVPDMLEGRGLWAPFVVPVREGLRRYDQAGDPRGWQRLGIAQGYAIELLQRTDQKGEAVLEPEMLGGSLSDLANAVEALRSRVVALSAEHGASAVECSRWEQRSRACLFWPPPPLQVGDGPAELRIAAGVGSFLATLADVIPEARAKGLPIRVDPLWGGGISIMDRPTMTRAMQADSDDELNQVVERYVTGVAVPHDLAEVEREMANLSSIEILMFHLGPKRRAEASGRVDAAIWYLAESAGQRVADAPGNRVAYFVAEGAEIEPLRNRLEDLAKGLIDPALVTSAGTPLHPDEAQAIGPALKELSERASGKKAAEKMAKLCASIAESGGKALVATDWTK